MKKKDAEEMMMSILFMVAFVSCYILFDTGFLRAVFYCFAVIIASEQLTDWFHEK